jgi:ADP-heptose:LPS heptosyltransferase
VLDLHGVLRTNLLDALFLLTGCRIYRIRKHRKLRRKILKHKKAGLGVPHAVIRYLRVFEKAGLTGKISGSAFPPTDHPARIARINKEEIRIGIAPISKHKTKNWGLNNVSKLISLLRLKYPVEIHLFGGPEDQPALDSLSGPDVFNHAGVFGPLDEISLIQKMDVFISMDSANMHLASLAGVATVSVWGATDPSLGFSPLHQPDDYSLYSDPADVFCRPCSVYGEIPCKRTDAPMICMNSIKPGKVLNKISEILLLSDKN